MAHLVKYVEKFKRGTVGEKGKEQKLAEVGICGGNKNQKRRFGQRIGSRWGGSGSYSARIDRTGSGKPMETLPGPKTAIKNSKIQKMPEKSKNLNFRIFSYFPS